MVDTENPTTSAAPPPPPPRSAGAMLADAREKAGLSIDAAATQLKLAPRQVRALESGDFAALPGRTFVRGFVRNYARLLDVDAQAVLAALPAGDEPGLSHPHLASTHRAMGEIPAERARRRSFTGWAIVLALAAIIAVAALYEKMRPPWPMRAPATVEQPAVETPRNDAPGTNPPPGTPEGRSLPNPAVPPASAPAPDSSTPPRSGAAETGAVLAMANPVSTTTASPAPAPAETPATPAVTLARAEELPAIQATSTSADAATPTAVGASNLQINFRGTSWVDIKDGKGSSILTMTGSEGTTRTLDAAPPLSLVVGNADHVDMTFRGARVDLAAHSRQNVARLTLR